MHALLRRALLGTLLALLSVAATAQDLTGRWYGDGYQPGGYHQYLTTRTVDGKIVIQFRKFDGCDLIDQWTEAGLWSVTEDIYTTIILRIGGEPDYVVNRYGLELVEGDLMLYRHIELDWAFEARRVGDDFQWPACDPKRLPAT